MNSIEKTKPTRRPINVGVYGATKAGKTRFLFELLEYWKQTDRLLPQSNETLAFMAQVRAEIDRHGESLPTAAATEGIAVSVGHDPQEQAWELKFRDLRGELLANEIPPDGNIQRDGVVARQVRECDAFLFFFDPASSEHPDDIEKHHQRELQRAFKFIDYVLEARQNEHFPIVFVQTHRDRWDHDDGIRMKAEYWASAVHARLVELYKARLRGYFPRCLTDRGRTFFCISSVGSSPDAKQPLEKIIEELKMLVADCDVFQDRMRKSGRGYLLAAVVAGLLLVLLYWIISASGGAHPESPPGSRTTIAEMTESEILEKLRELEQLLKAYPPGAPIPNVNDAETINHHLRWLAQRLEPNSEDPTQNRMKAAFNAAARLIRETTDRQEALADRMPVLTAFLSELPDLTSTAFGDVQGRYWQLQRSFVLEQCANLIERRGKVNSPAKVALTELVKTMQSLEQEMKQCKVWSSESRRILASEIRTAWNFCEDQLKSNNYPIQFRVASALILSPQNADLNLRNLRILSPNQNQSDSLSRDGIGLFPNDQEIPIDIRATILWGAECWDGYQNEVTLQVDGIELWKGSVKSTKDTTSELPVQRTLRKRGDELAFDAHILVTDGIFIWSSREHGKGSLRVNVGKLLDQEHVLELDKYGNRIRIAASRADDGQPGEFHTKQFQYDAELGLGSPVNCILSVHRSNKWEELHEFILTTESGPLAPLGMPLLFRGESHVSKILQGGGMQIKLEILVSQTVPLILWEAAVRAKEPAP